MDKNGAREIVYGMPFAEWRDKFQKEATPEQQAKFAEAQQRPLIHRVAVCFPPKNRRLWITGRPRFFFDSQASHYSRDQCHGTSREYHHG